MFKLLGRIVSGCLLLCASMFSPAIASQPQLPSLPNAEDVTRLPWGSPSYASGVIFEVELVEGAETIARYQLGIPGLTAAVTKSEVSDMATRFSAQLYSIWMMDESFGVSLYFQWGGKSDGNALDGRSTLGLKVGERVVLATKTEAPARSLVVRLVPVESNDKNKAAGG